METIGYILAFATGIIMGMVGAGGSILTSGLLVYIFGVSPLLAPSYTIVNVGVMSLVGCWQYHRKELVDVATGLLFCLPACIMVMLMRRYIMPAIPDTLLQYDQFVFSKALLIMLVFAALMIFIAWKMIRPANREGVLRVQQENKPLILLTGLCVGLLTGFVGAGGGFIIVPALIVFTGLEVKEAVGTSLFIITINSMIGFICDYTNGVVYDWDLLLVFITITVAGMVLSTLFMTKLKTDLLKRIFAVMMLATGCWIIVKELFLKE